MVSDRQVGDDTSQLLQDEYAQNFEFHVEEDVSHVKLTCYLHIKPKIKANIPLTMKLLLQAKEVQLSVSSCESSVTLKPGFKLSESPLNGKRNGMP